MAASGSIRSFTGRAPAASCPYVLVGKVGWDGEYLGSSDDDDDDDGVAAAESGAEEEGCPRATMQA